MLLELNLFQFATVEEMNLSLPSGFLAVTGETGAGKSLFVQALSLLRGERPMGEEIREGAKEAVIEGIFHLTNPEILLRLKEEGYGTDEEILVRRILRRGGNHRVYIQGRSATTHLLEECIAPHLEVYRQGSQDRLLSPKEQTFFLDRAGSLIPFRKKVENLYYQMKEKEGEWKECSNLLPQREKEMDYLQFVLSEFSRISPRPDEIKELEEKWRVRKEYEEALHLGKEIWKRIYEENGILPLLYDLERLLSRGEPFYILPKPLRDRFQEAIATIEEIGKKYKTPPPSPSPSEESIESIESRLNELKRLERKYGGYDSALKEWERYRKEWEKWENLEKEVLEKEKVYREIRENYLQEARTLSEMRKEKAKQFSSMVVKNLLSMALPHGKFEVRGFGEGEEGPDGIDAIEFFFSANPGEQVKPLRRIASGGEKSRLFLAIHSTFGFLNPLTTVVFDEVDTGISGPTALQVGLLLRSLGKDHQVIVVTHNPQTTACAHHQIFIWKEVREGRTFTQGKLLSEEERIQEIARLLGSEEMESALQHAQKLLSQVEGIL